MLGRKHLSIFGTVSVNEIFVLLFFSSTVFHQSIFLNVHLFPSETDSLVDTLRGTDLATDFVTQPNVGGITGQLKLVARLISIRNERGNGINRDVFYCEMGGEFPCYQFLSVLYYM